MRELSVDVWFTMKRCTLDYSNGHASKLRHSYSQKTHSTAHLRHKCYHARTPVIS